jgi:hypothetical protein
MHKYRATIFMALVATFCLVIHFWTGWEAAIDEAETHGTTMTMSTYLVEWTRDTFENLQSEFWQLAVQFALLAGLFEFMKVHAYEEDIEDIMKRLERIESSVNKLNK